MAKNKNNKAQNNKQNAEFAEEFNQNAATGKASNQATQNTQK
ncbi:hypothetical protein PALU110988_13980 [Paenibacillus lupini]|jgi:hypothetical protein|nr:hypothetical protein [Paenibacillus lupini]NIK25130.1 hypothetical protein [Paenibacillus lupini]